MTNYYRDYANPAVASTDTPNQMRLSARDLRSRAPHMIDSNDREIVLRLADAYEKRADAMERQRMQF